MPKTQTPRNAFAPQADSNALFNVVPQPGWEQRVVPTPRRRMTPLEFLDQLVTGYSYGAGKARVGDLQAIYDLATRPRGVYQDLVNAARDVASNPGAVVNALRASAQNAMSSPYAFGQAAGSFGLPKIGRKPGGIRSELDVYHGTPHTFEPEEGAPLGRFRSEKIGTGEGKQAYGYGLYFAENPSVGGEYRGNLSYREMVKKFRKEMPDNADVDEALEWANSGTAPPDMARVIKALNDDDWLGFDYPSQALNALFKEPDAFQLSDELKAAADKMRGNLYKVDLPDAKIEQMLDWDKPISQQPAMQKAFNKFWKGLSKNERAQAVLDEFGDYDFAEEMAKTPGEMKGRLAYTLMTHHFGDQAEASDFLRQQGIPGIKYFDADSRTSKQGTRNFVVFPGEEQNLTILERDGVKAEVPKVVGPYAPKPMPKLIRDNPGGDWLAQKRKYSEAQGTKPSGAFNYPGELTASYDDTVYVPVSVLEKIPGENMEQYNVRQHSLDWLTKEMSEKKRLPTYEAGGKEYDNAPFITVDSKGRPFVTEGNHRIKVAKELGWQYLPVEVRYFNGGELEDGPFSPKQLAKFAQQGNP